MRSAKLIKGHYKIRIILKGQLIKSDRRTSSFRGVSGFGVKMIFRWYRRKGHSSMTWKGRVECIFANHAQCMPYRLCQVSRSSGPPFFPSSENLGVGFQQAPPPVRARVKLEFSSLRVSAFHWCIKLTFTPPEAWQNLTIKMNCNYKPYCKKGRLSQNVTEM